MKKDHTLIGMIVDKSGSMHSLTDDAIGGYNSLIEDQRKIPGTAQIIKTIFDTQVDIGEVENLNSCELLSKENYQPNGYTALFDAIGKTVDHIGVYLNKLPEPERPEKVIICIITDGDENASRHFTLNDIKNKITHQEEVYNWQFIFSGANIDAFAVGSGLGIKTHNTVQYDPTSVGTRSAYASMSASVASLRA
jgi:hypothetical protein